jgi:hypothetical protein
MANTTPDNIQYPVNSDQVAPLASHFKNLADSTQAALNTKADAFTSIDGNTVTVQIKRNTEANWTSTNPTLAAGEIGFETDTGLSKVGNGSSAWTSLAYTASSTMKQVVKAGESLTRGQAVYASGSDGTYLVVSKASNATEATSSKTLGLINQDLASGATGRLVTEGLLNGVNTSTATAGDPVWLGTSGNLLYGMANKPVAPAHLVFIGIVTVANTSGTIYIRPQNGFELDELHNVLITSPADKQVLAYESATQLWKNKQATGGVTVGATAPSSPNSGDAWFDSNDGTLYVWYVDANTSQWVQVQANSALEGTILARLGALESQAIAFGNRQSNAIINGDFSINQRGFTSSTTAGMYCFDRWKQNFGGAGTITYTAGAFTPGAAPVSGYEAANYLTIATTGQSNSTDYAGIIQPIEDVRTFAGQTVTISLWAKAASGTPKVAVTLEQLFGTGGSPSSNVQTAAGSVTLSTAWQRYAVTVAVPSIAGKTIGTTANTSCLILELFTSLGTSFSSYGNIGLQTTTISFWGVQAEPGTVATAFRRAAGTIQGELAACQRYYATSFIGAQGTFKTSTSASIGIKLPVTMRATPTVQLKSGASNVTLDYYGGTVTATISDYNVSGPNFARVSFGGFTGRNFADPAFIGTDQIEAIAEL